jgi:hypothetical protein
MSSPLDDLRNTTKSLQQKKDANVEKIKQEQLHQQEILEKKLIDQRKQAKQEARALANKSRNIKITILSVIIASLCVFLAYSINMMIKGASTTAKKSKLVSDDSNGIDANHKDYVSLKKLSKLMISNFQKNPDNPNLPWYESLPIEKKKCYLELLKDMNFDDTWAMHTIREDKKREKFNMTFKDGAGNSITFEIIRNPDLILKIVKIY